VEIDRAIGSAAICGGGIEGIMGQRRKIVQARRPRQIPPAARAAELRDRIAALSEALASEKDFSRQCRLLLSRKRSRSALRKVEAKMQRLNEAGAIAAPPIAGWVLIAWRQISAGGIVYPCGSEVPAEALGRNLSALLSAHYCEWRPARSEVTAKPRTLPPPAPLQKPNPPAALVDDADPVVSWRKSVAAMATQLDDDHARARDLLLRDARGSELYTRAQRVLGERAERSRQPMEILR
jgi:hypothetical protein